MAAPSRTSKSGASFQLASLLLFIALFSVAAFPFSFWRTAAAGGSSVTAPNQIANLKAWFKASDFDATTDGTEVTSWTDLTSGAPNTVTATGAATNRPVVRRNAINTSMTALEVANKNGFAKSSGFTLTSTANWTVFAVLKFTAEATTENDFFAFNDGNGSGMRLGRTPAAKVTIIFPNVGNYLTTETHTLNVWHYIVILNGGSGRQVFMDGTQQTITTGSQSGTTSGIKLMEGASLAGDLMRGQAAEYVIYNGTVSTGDRQSGLEAYARTRYGLP